MSATTDRIEELITLLTPIIEKDRPTWVERATKTLKEDFKGLKAYELRELLMQYVVGGTKPMHEESSKNIAKIIVESIGWGDPEEYPTAQEELTAQLAFDGWE